MRDSSFLERRPVLRFLFLAFNHWRERHQTPFSFWIHMLGIPLAVAGAFWFLGACVVQDWNHWEWMLGTFLGGYALQSIGHWWEGNTMGELIPLYRSLGWKYLAIAPQFQNLAHESRSAKPGSELAQ